MSIETSPTIGSINKQSGIPRYSYTAILLTKETSPKHFIVWLVEPKGYHVRNFHIHIRSRVFNLFVCCFLLKIQGYNHTCVLLPVSEHIFNVETYCIKRYSKDNSYIFYYTFRNWFSLYYYHTRCTLKYIKVVLFCQYFSKFDVILK